MEKLARRFASLARAPGLQPWAPGTLAGWGRACGYGSAELSAARFVLWVWSPRVLWPCGRFDLFEALLSWEAADRSAFMAWLARPWWCMGESPVADVELKAEPSTGEDDANGGG
jgi:hypothetical protein